MTNDTGRLTWALGQVQQFFCGINGHDALLHFEQGRMSLQCASCGYETPGWDVKGRAANTEPPARRVQLPLVSQRRVA